MLEQTVDAKQIDLGVVTPGTCLASGAKQQQTEVKKTALRDLQNDIRIVSPQNAAIRVPTTEGIKVSGTKRPSPERPMALPSRQPPANNGMNGNLVYIRRKSDQEVEKSNIIDLDSSSSCPPPKEVSQGIQEVSRQQQSPLQGSKGYSAITPIPGSSVNTYSVGGPSLPVSLAKTATPLPSDGDVNHTAVNAGNLHIPQKKSEPDFKERFIRLQAFLKNYDNSSHEDYIQTLRALPSVGRSRHAVELEKRAIHLLLEEKKELERMKVLNVLGKSTPRDNASPAIPQATPGK
ncbi:hypothetical protein ACHQM5_018928 [Ranunculus cassubicifolius]